MSSLKKQKNILRMQQRCLKMMTKNFSSKKDVYVNLTYAELYMAQTRYEEALSLYEQLLSQSAEEELGLEEVIYQQMCKIYQERNDFENYKKYSTLYSDQIIKNNKNFSKTYVSSNFERCINISCWQKKRDNINGSAGEYYGDLRVARHRGLDCQIRDEIKKNELYRFYDWLV